MIIALIGCVPIVGSEVAHAQQDAASQAAARTMFEEGVVLADDGRWAEAADRFERAHRLRQSPVIANNLALAYIQLGRYVEASELFRAIARDESAAEEVRQAAETELGQVLGRTGRLTIHLDGPATDLELTVDTRPLDLAVVDRPFPADPGIRAIAALRQREVVASGEVEVVQGADSEVTLTIPPLPEEPTPEPTPRVDLAPREPTALEADDGGSLWWLWTILSVAVVGGAVAIIAGVSAGGSQPVPGNLGILEVP